MPEYFLEFKSKDRYLNTDPVNSGLRLSLGSDPHVMIHNLKVGNVYTTSDLMIEKLIVFLMETSLLINNPLTENKPGLHMYDIAMRKYFMNNFGEEVPDLVEKWSKKCWSCYAEKDSKTELMTDRICKVAQYCSKECQVKDWKKHKLLHQEFENVQGFKLGN